MARALNEKMTICPYDKSHIMREDRLQYHLIKCRRNNKDRDFQICPFMATHHVPKSEFIRHVETCPNRNFAGRNPEFRTNTALPPVYNSSFMLDNDDPFFEEANESQTNAAGSAQKVRNVDRKALARDDVERKREINKQPLSHSASTSASQCSVNGDLKNAESSQTKVKPCEEVRNVDHAALVRAAVARKRDRDKQSYPDIASRFASQCRVNGDSKDGKREKSGMSPAETLKQLDRSSSLMAFIQRKREKHKLVDPVMASVVKPQRFNPQYDELFVSNSESAGRGVIFRRKK